MFWVDWRNSISPKKNIFLLLTKDNILLQIKRILRNYPYVTIKIIWLHNVLKISLFIYIQDFLNLELCSLTNIDQFPLWGEPGIKSFYSNYPIKKKKKIRPNLILFLLKRVTNIRARWSFTKDQENIIIKLIVNQIAKQWPRFYVKHVRKPHSHI